MVGVARVDRGGGRGGVGSAVGGLERAWGTPVGFVTARGAAIRMETFVLLLRAGCVGGGSTMGVARCVVGRMGWGCGAGKVVEELVWTEILCGGRGCGGRAGALSLCVEHHLLIGPLGELGVCSGIKEVVLRGMKRVGLLILVKGRVKGLGRVTLGRLLYRIRVGRGSVRRGLLLWVRGRRVVVGAFHGEGSDKGHRLAKKYYEQPNKKIKIKRRRRRTGGSSEQVDEGDPRWQLAQCSSHQSQTRHNTSSSSTATTTRINVANQFTSQLM